MGPFPHDDRQAEISEDNPAGTNGFAFVEFAHPDADLLRRMFTAMGYTHTATASSRSIELWQQGDITYILNAEEGSFASRFMADHGPCAPSMGWRVADPHHAYDHALAHGATPYDGDDKTLNAPAIIGIGGSLIYFLADDGPLFDEGFTWHADAPAEGAGFYYIDHLTHNVFKGNMDRWFRFYGDLFHFKEIRFFDIQGKYTGLLSRALTSPCGRIRIPINEDRGEEGQIVAYLKKYRGEGIQHIAVGARNIYAATDTIADAGITFMSPPPPVYYDRSHDRIPDHGEPVEKMKKHGILIDGEGVVNGGETKILLQIFSKTLIGPIFFEFIQRKGDDGFGEGNFKALFESIEAQQIRDGELSVAE